MFNGPSCVNVLLNEFDETMFHLPEKRITLIKRHVVSLVAAVDNVSISEIIEYVLQRFAILEIGSHISRQISTD